MCNISCTIHVPQSPSPFALQIQAHALQSHGILIRTFVILYQVILYYHNMKLHVRQQAKPTRSYPNIPDR